MDYIDFNNCELVNTLTTSSKGNQQKWFINNKWYKADNMGYEALCEVVISKLLKKSNINNFAEYSPVKIKYNNKVTNGCVSENFRKKNESIITLEHLSKIWLASSMAKELTRYKDIKDKITHTVDFIEKVTDLTDVGKYLTLMLELDSFFLNEDRHTNNIAFIRNDETQKYSFCPYFDFGLSLLADTTVDYPLNGDIYLYRSKIKAKPFSDSFDEQTETAEKIYGEQLKLYFTNTDIEKAFNNISDYYDNEITERAKTLLYYQKTRYSYLFK